MSCRASRFELPNCILLALEGFLDFIWPLFNQPVNRVPLAPIHVKISQNYCILNFSYDI